jgi:hypothetical protein
VLFTPSYASYHYNDDPMAIDKMQSTGVDLCAFKPTPIGPCTGCDVCFRTGDTEISLTEHGEHFVLGQAIPLFIEWSVRAREADIGKVTHDMALKPIPNVQNMPKLQFVTDTAENRFQLQGFELDTDGTGETLAIPYSKAHFIAYILDHWSDFDQLRAADAPIFEEQYQDEARAEAGAAVAEKAKEDKATQDQADQEAERARKVEDVFH